MKYKYVHILFRNELKFNARIVDLINSKENGFNLKDHVFVTPYQESYEILKKYPNVIYDNQSKNLLNTYANKCDWIIAHSFDNIWTIIGASNYALKKTMYRYWGGGIEGCSEKPGNITNPLRKLFNRYYQSKISKLACIGIANVVDEILIRKFFPDIPIYIMSYSTNGIYESIVAAANATYNNTSTLNVLLGHRGSSEENHIGILKLLSKYENENMKIFIPLSYGDEAYINRVKKYVKDNHLKQVVIIDEFMEYADYCKFLNQMDVAIFDGNSSYALGNISLLLFYKKKIFLNESGVLREAFDHESVPSGTISEIGKMSFEDFAAKVLMEPGVEENLTAHDLDFSLNKWRMVFRAFS